MKQFKVGDLVRFVAGGPKMAVSGHRTAAVANGPSVALVVCQWFTLGREFRQADFTEALLRPAGEAAPPP